MIVSYPLLVYFQSSLPEVIPKLTSVARANHAGRGHARVWAAFGNREPYFGKDEP